VYPNDASGDVFRGLRFCPQMDTDENIEQHSIEIEELCANFDADYDGWGTEVEVLP